MSLYKTLKSITCHPLNRRQKLNALLRFVRWQLSSRLSLGETVYEWLGGVKVIVRNGETGFTGNIYCGLHEFPDMAFLLHFLRDEDLFIDVGANVGSYTLLSSGVVGARSLSFEPVPSTFIRLSDNIRINDLLGKVALCNMGVGSSKGCLKFTTDENCTNHVILDDETPSSLMVDVDCLDNLSADVPAIIKIDVEGYETEVLNGAKNLLSNNGLHVLIMELNDSGARYGYTDDSLVSTMNSFGFSPYEYDPFQGILTELDDKNFHQGNTIFIRDIDFVNARLNSRKSYTVLGASF